VTVLLAYVYGPSVATNGNGDLFKEQEIYRNALLAELTGPNGVDIGGLDYEIRLLRGCPSTVIAEVAREWNADEIYVGPGRAGGVFEELVRISDCPVTRAPVTGAQPGAQSSAA
jgi:hypothetical protein